MLRIYGSKVSYFTGKLEAYLRVKGLAHERVPISHGRKKIREKVGAIQAPVLELEDGRWASDTTPIIAYFEQAHPEPAVYPADPVQRFIGLLVEDYADEWLWRPAMHYRWSYRPDARLLSRIIAEELLDFVPLPGIVKRRFFNARQRIGYVIRDGVSAGTRAHVEQGYHNALASMDSVLATRPFLFGETPTLADIGLMGPMLRHFGQDPTPAEIMRDTAPEVMAWLGRVWSATAPNTSARLVNGVPDDLQPLLREVRETHLVQLRENARAYAAGKTHFAQTVQGCSYPRIPVSRYRVWCLEQLRRAYTELDQAQAAEVRRLLGPAGNTRAEAELLWQPEALAESGYDPEGLAPFNRAIKVRGA